VPRVCLFDCLFALLISIATHSRGCIFSLLISLVGIAGSAAENFQSALLDTLKKLQKETWTPALTVADSSSLRRRYAACSD